MKTPLFLIEDRDVSMFRTVSDLGRYVESPDIDAYEVFDAEGTKLSMEVIELDRSRPGFGIPVNPVRIVEATGAENESARLLTLLSEFLARCGHTLPKDSPDLSDVVAEFVSLGLYTS